MGDLQKGVQLCVLSASIVFPSVNLSQSKRAFHLGNQLVFPVPELPSYSLSENPQPAASPHRRSRGVVRCNTV